MGFFILAKLPFDLYANFFFEALFPPQSASINYIWSEKVPLNDSRASHEGANPLLPL